MPQVRSKIRQTIGRAERRARRFLADPSPPKRPDPWSENLRDMFAWARSTGAGGRYPQYTWGTLLAARTARNLRIDEISVMEFGVAGGNGLLALESAADVAEDLLGVRIQVFGFDSAAGLPEPQDYRDVPYRLRGGDFRMNEPELRSRLQRSELVLGYVDQTIDRFVGEAHPPAGFVSIDLDYYSSTMDALRLLDAPTKGLVPRVVFYFDDLNGYLYSDINGERAAIGDFNAAHEYRKLSPVRALRYDLPQSEAHLAWHEQLYIAHILDHELYSAPEIVDRPHPSQAHTKLRA
jgi:hypothetical protein